MSEIMSEIKEDFPIEVIDLEDETYQARFDYDEKKIGNLAKDIERFGQREPIGVRASPNKEGMFQVIYGFQRVKAIKTLDRITIKAQVYEGLSERDCQELAVRDNEMHGDLTQMEKALQCKKLKNEGWTVDELRESFNAQKSAIYNWLKVAELDEITLGLIHHEFISVYHGLALSKVEFSRRLEILKDVIGWNWSVRDVEQWISEGRSPVMKIGIYGWISNCWKDLRWKSINKCQECEFYEGTREENGQKMIKCKANETGVVHPKAIEQFLYEAGWRSDGTHPN